MRRFVAISAGFALASINFGADVLPEMAKHLSFGHECIKRGVQSGAVAASDLIILDQIRVFVDESASTPQTREALAESEFIWEDALNSETKFVRVISKSEADVVVKFQAGLVVEGQEAGGFTEWSRAIRWKNGSYVPVLKAEITIRTIRPDGGQMSKEQALNACLHEYGHLLGLDDCSVRGEVMAPLKLSKPVLTPARSEVEALQDLRAKARNLRLAATSRRSD